MSRAVFLCCNKRAAEGETPGQRRPSRAADGGATKDAAGPGDPGAAQCYAGEATVNAAGSGDTTADANRPRDPLSRPKRTPGGWTTT